MDIIKYNNNNNNNNNNKKNNNRNTIKVLIFCNIWGTIYVSRKHAIFFEIKYEVNLNETLV